MIQLRFNPFDKALNELTAEDLATLRTVAEGWYVEYKAKKIDHEKIAKSISSFANHYGGWLFFGVEEAKADDGSLVASAFPGIPKSEVGSLVSRLSEAVARHMNPDAYFEHKVLGGPCKSIGLADDRSVIAIEIPGGANPPYVHKNGRIYRRIADRSEPTAETDRAVLDMLWERGRRKREAFADQIRALPEKTEEEVGRPYVHLFLFADPLGDRGYKSKMTFEQFSELMKTTPRSSGKLLAISMNLENCFSTAEGFVARHISTQQADDLTLTWRFNRNGTSLITIPLSRTAATLPASHEWFDKYEHWDRFLGLAESNRFNGWVLDMNSLFFCFVALLAKARSLHAIDGYEGNLFAKIHAEGLLRSVSFLDVPAFVDAVESNGIPVLQDNSILVPAGWEPESALELKSLTEVGAKEIQPEFMDTFPLLMRWLTAIGFQPISDTKDKDAFTEALVEVVKDHVLASFRAVKTDQLSSETSDRG